jgi:UDP-N-acetylmuramate--alanine ligase
MTMVRSHVQARSDNSAPLGPNVCRVHMVGIGGAGMEGLARLLQQMGYRVTGSDAADGPVVDDLRRSGIAVFHGHDVTQTRGADLLIYSAAVAQDNVERQAASMAGIRQMRRAEALGKLTQDHDTIAVSGTHGKTTTASLIASVTQAAGLQPTTAIGGWVSGKSQSAHGAGPLMVVEADEYDRSFHDLHPWLTVVTNLEAEHVDCYEDEDELLNAFVTFVRRSRPDGCVVINGDDPLCRRLAEQVASEAESPALITFGWDARCDVHASEISPTFGGSTFTCHGAAGDISLTLQIPGRHNIANALAACAVAQVLSLDAGDIASGLADFAGVDRRFQNRGLINGVHVVDDYAHHPTEVAAALATAREQMMDGRLMVVWQPHTYSRTSHFQTEFADVLGRADRIWVTAVYAAREQPEAGIESDTIVNRLVSQGAEARWEADTAAALHGALASCSAGDWLLVMGAGDVSAQLDTLLRELQD